MVFKCIVRACGGPPSTDNHFYRFPTEGVLLRMWCSNLKISPPKLTSMIRICSRHFDPSCRGIKRLLGGAIPTVDLGHDEEDIFLPVLCFKEKKRKCCIVECRSDSDFCSLYSFPKSKEIRMAWLEVCGLQDHPSKQLFICGNHFDDSFIGRKKLKKGAFPKLNLSQNIEDIDNVEELSPIENACGRCHSFCKEAGFYRRKLREAEAAYLKESALLKKQIEDLKNEIIELKKT